MAAQRHSVVKPHPDIGVFSVSIAAISCPDRSASRVKPGSVVQNAPKSPSQGEGEARAQTVWHVSCWVEQFIEHDTLALALLVVVAAPVGAVPGTKQLAL